MMHDMQVAEEPGLRERKKRARREALVDAAHQLVGQHGLDHVTVEMISSAAGVSVRTFFNYFDTKDDAVLGIGQWSLDPVVAQQFAEGGPTGKLMADLEVLMASLLDSPPLGKARMERSFELAKHDPRLLVRAFALFDEHGAQLGRMVRDRLGDQADESLVQLVGAVMLAVGHATFVRWDSAGGQGEVRDQLPAVMSDLCGILKDS